jgi:hypothetical protein
MYTSLPVRVNALCTHYYRNDAERLRLSFGSTIMSYDTFHGVRGG